MAPAAGARRRRSRRLFAVTGATSPAVGRRSSGSARAGELAVGTRDAAGLAAGGGTADAVALTCAFGTHRYELRRPARAAESEKPSR